MHRASTSLSGCLAALLSCTPEPQPLGQYFDVCESTADCEAPLQCVGGRCLERPEANLGSPEDLEVFEQGEVLYAWVPIEGFVAGDQAELTFDPFTEGASTSVVVDVETLQQEYNYLEISAPAQPGPHWLRLRVLDADGKPYENERASDYSLVFVRDELIPDKPFIAFLEPRPDLVHPRGEPLDFTLVAMPGSFAFSNYGSECTPLPDCPEPFDPACESSCGPVSRTGSARFYLDQALPDCVLDEPSCAYSFVGGTREQLDAVVMAGTLDMDAQALSAGQHTLSSMLFYQFDPYPSEAAPVFTSQPLRVE